MKDKNKKQVEETPPPYTEGYWEDTLHDEIEEIQNIQPSSNMGSWWKQIQLDKLKLKLKRYKK